MVGLQVILYAWAMVACSLLLIPVAGMGLLALAPSLVAGGWFIYESHRLYNLAIRHETVSPMRVFHGSMLPDADLPRRRDRPAAAVLSAAAAGARREVRTRATCHEGPPGSSMCA